MVTIAQLYERLRKKRLMLSKRQCSEGPAHKSNFVRSKRVGFWRFLSQLLQSLPWTRKNPVNKILRKQRTQDLSASPFGLHQTSGWWGACFRTAPPTRVACRQAITLSRLTKSQHRKYSLLNSNTGRADGLKLLWS